MLIGKSDGMKISDLELFTAVAKEKSFSKAAQRLYISQSAVTQHIKKIEMELGFALFERNTHFAALTEQGEIMLRTAQEMLKQYHKALAMCSRNEAQTKLTVFYIGTASQRFLPEVLKQFHARFPTCSIASRRVRLAEAWEALEKGETNLLILPADMFSDSQGWSFLPLYQDAFYCVMNENNPLAVREALDYKDLAGKTLLAPSRVSCPDSMRQVLDRVQEEVELCELVWENNIDSVVLHLRSSGSDCLAIMPGHALPEHPQLCAVPFRAGINIQVGLAYAHPMSLTEETFASLARDHTHFGK